MAISNSQYDKIIREYDEARLRHARELSARKAEINAKIPEYKPLEDQISALSMAYARMRISASINPDLESVKKEYHEKLLDIKLKKNRLLEQYGYSKDYLEMEYDCNECKDTGYVDGEKCSCFMKKQVKLVYDFSRMKEFLENNNFSLLSRDYYQGEGLRQFEEAVTTCKNFINNFYSDYRNLLFYGTVGTGKSFLSGCVAKELLDKGCSIIYISAVNLFQTIYNYIYSPAKETYIWFNESLLECDLLIIDDLGTETTNDFIRTHFFEIINERNLKKHSTIISANLTLEDIRSRYSDRVFSRIYENYERLHLSEIKDIRIQKKLEQSV